MITCPANTPAQTEWFATLATEHATEVAAFTAWCAREGIDPNGAMSRDEYEIAAA